MTRIVLDLPDVDEAAELVHVLLAAADRCTLQHPARAAQWRHLANGIGDGLDVLDQLYTPAVTR